LTVPVCNTTCFGGIWQLFFKKKKMRYNWNFVKFAWLITPLSDICHGLYKIYPSKKNQDFGRFYYIYHNELKFYYYWWKLTILINFNIYREIVCVRLWYFVKHKILCALDLYLKFECPNDRSKPLNMINFGLCINR
jgi:hypothetical protein